MCKELNMELYSKKKKLGCPTCDGVEAKSCLRCFGKTRMCDWFNTPDGWTHASELGIKEFRPRVGNHRSPFGMGA